MPRFSCQTFSNTQLYGTILTQRYTPRQSCQQTQQIDTVRNCLGNRTLMWLYGEQNLYGMYARNVVRLPRYLCRDNLGFCATFSPVWSVINAKYDLPLFGWNLPWETCQVFLLQTHFLHKLRKYTLFDWLWESHSHSHIDHFHNDWLMSLSINDAFINSLYD